MTSTNSQTPQDLVITIISDNPRFDWLWEELGTDFTFQQVEECLERYGYGLVYREFKK